MLHRARKKQSPEDKTAAADEAIKSERCAILRQIYNEISTIASASKKTNCEVQIEVVREWTDLNYKMSVLNPRLEESGMIDANMYYRRNHASHLGADKRNLTTESSK
jgi:hypothetical protein